MGWTRSSDGAGNKYVQKNGGETLWKAITWKTEKEMGSVLK
jgi:hypothetical protein